MFGLNHRSGKKGLEYPMDLQMLPAGRKVSVWWTKPKGWEGPYTFMPIYGETDWVQLIQERRIVLVTFRKAVCDDALGPDLRGSS